MDFFVSKVSERRVVVRPWSSNEGRRTMFDALLYCHVTADIRHGYFLIVADFVRAITAEFRALWVAAKLGRKTATTLPQTAGCTPVVDWTAENWTQGLARLETYVASMA
jgi:hypothetical protein